MHYAHFLFHLLPNMSRNFGHGVCRLDTAEDFLQLSNKPGSMLREMQGLLVNIGATLEEEISKSIRVEKWFHHNLVNQS